MLAEIEQTLNTLERLRGQVGGIIQSTPLAGLNWRPELPQGADPVSSLAVLGVHTAGSEHFWIAELIGARPQTRVRDEEFAFVAGSADEVLDRLAKVAAQTREILSAVDAEKLASSIAYDDHLHLVRWILHHVISHYGLHIGHMQLTYQLWNQGMASTAPPWIPAK
ncbi:MAG: DinB family protein [Anaerolineales bacterium]|nr:DinB family protein [Anaerolineales bacterium]